MEKFAGWFLAAALGCGLASAQSDANKTTASGMQAVQSWTGVLVDANCAAGGGAANSQAAADSGAQSKNEAVDSGRPEKGHKKKHGEMQSCPVSSSTSAFALKTKDGQVMKFDAVGNARAAEELKTKGSWSKDIAGGKPVHAKVSGTLNGDSITVTSISGPHSMG